MQIRRSRAAVTGDELHDTATAPLEREGVDSRQTRKPEDRPKHFILNYNFAKELRFVSHFLRSTPFFHTIYFS